MEAGTSPTDPRQQALDSIKRKRAFWAQAGTFVAIGVLLTIIYFVADPNSFFWPIFPMGGFLIALASQAWTIWGPGARPITEDQIERESERLNR